MKTKLEIYGKISEMIRKYHNKDLVKPNKSPNENKITLLYNDGEIIDTKGGWAFMQRSMFTKELPLLLGGYQIKYPKSMLINWCKFFFLLILYRRNKVHLF